jgi:hypothetical protein
VVVKEGQSRCRAVSWPRSLLCIDVAPQHQAVRLLAAVRLNAHRQAVRPDGCSRASWWSRQSATCSRTGRSRVRNSLPRPFSPDAPLAPAPRPFALVKWGSVAVAIAPVGHRQYVAESTRVPWRPPCRFPLVALAPARRWAQGRPILRQSPWLPGRPRRRGIDRSCRLPFTTRTANFIVPARIGRSGRIGGILSAGPGVDHDS